MRIASGARGIARCLPTGRGAAAALVLALAMVLETAAPAFAAMDATLSSDHGRPGDAVLLMSDDHNGRGTYWGLSTENHQSIFLAPIGADPAKGCSGPDGRMLGHLEWRGNAGGVSFLVPSLPFGDYWFFMLTSGQCWRIAGIIGTGRTASHQILVLSVGSVPADNQ